jgi:hypothetical protein
LQKSIDNSPFFDRMVIGLEVIPGPGKYGLAVYESDDLVGRRAHEVELANAGRLVAGNKAMGPPFFYCGSWPVRS